MNKKSSSYNTYKCCWIRKIINNNLFPIIEIIEECDNLEQSNIRERYYIEKLTIDGYKLTNSYITDVTEFSSHTKREDV